MKLYSSFLNGKILKYTFPVIILVTILLLFSGCNLFESPQDIPENKEDTSYDSIESEITEQGEENQEESGTEEESAEEAEEVELEADINSLEEETPQEFPETSIDIKVYYIDEQAEFLIGEGRTISGTSTVEFIEAVFNELLRDPVQGNLYNLIPEGTELINVEFIDNYAFLNLTPQFVENKVDDSLVDYLVVNCIAATMTEIPNVRGVIFKVDWKKIDVYGTLDVKNPVIRNQDLIKN